MERYDPSKDAWEMVAPMADKRINFGVGVMLGFIFVVGGHNGVSHLSSIERYDPHQNQWTVCRPMNEPRTGEFLGEVQRHILKLRSPTFLNSRATSWVLGHTKGNQFAPLHSTSTK